MEWFRNGFLDPTQVGQFAQPRRNEIRGALGILEDPRGIQNAEEPTEADLLVTYADPVISPGDIVTISIFELMTPGVSTDIQVQVSNLGFETIPALGRLRVAGFTPRELELDLKQRLREKEILEEAEVRVTPLQMQSAQFSVIGFVSSPGTYPLPRPDFRLLDAIAAFGGISEQVTEVYVIRKTKPGDGDPRAPGDFGVGSGMFTEALAQPVSYTMSDMSMGRAGGAPRAVQPATQKTIDELDILEGGPSEPPADPVWDAATSRWVIRSAAQPAAATRRAASRATQPMTSPGDEMFPGELPPPEAAADMTELLPPSRIIEIPMKDLLAHDPRYNIVIRPYDLINVPPVEQGAYYMAGHVARPGAYRFQGHPLTLKEAITSAGGFDALAWPARADLIRRVNQFEEQTIQVDLDAIFAGNAPDIYMKENDILNVGTTPIAPFLAVLRNSFRMSYGFGLVYDRNFADQDTFFAQEQRKNRRRVEAQAKGIPF